MLNIFFLLFWILFSIIGINLMFDFQSYYFFYIVKTVATIVVLIWQNNLYLEYITVSSDYFKDILPAPQKKRAPNHKVMWLVIETIYGNKKCYLVNQHWNFYLIEISRNCNGEILRNCLILLYALYQIILKTVGTLFS